MVVAREELGRGRDEVPKLKEVEKLGKCGTSRPVKEGTLHRRRSGHQHQPPITTDGKLRYSYGTAMVQLLGMSSKLVYGGNALQWKSLLHLIDPYRRSCVVGLLRETPKTPPCSDYEMEPDV
jgi:hypothetical protein